MEARPNLFGNFLVQDADDNAVYAAVPSYDLLRTALDAKLAEHNESNTVMNLVLFQQVRCSSARVSWCIVGNAYKPNRTALSVCLVLWFPVAQSVLHMHLFICAAGHGACVPNHTDPEPASRERNAGRGWRLWQAVAGKVRSVLCTPLLLIFKCRPHKICNALSISLSVPDSLEMAQAGSLHLRA